MANLSESTLLIEVRRRLDEITISGESVVTDADLEDLASSNFSDADLKKRMQFAAMNLVANVRAAFLPNLVETVSPARFLDHLPVRVLGSRVKVTSDDYGEVRATRRTFQGHRQLEARGVASSEQFPAYVYEDHILKVFPDPVDAGSSTTATVDILRFPGSYHGSTVSTKNIAVEELDERFANAIILRTLFYCYITLGLVEFATESQKRYIEELRPYLVPKTVLQ